MFSGHSYYLKSTRSLLDPEIETSVNNNKNFQSDVISLLYRRLRVVLDPNQLEGYVGEICGRMSHLKHDFRHSTKNNKTF